MADKRQCSLCGEPLEDAPAVHDLAQCEKTELLKGRDTIKKLTASLHEWKHGEGGWYFLRDQLGLMAWQHNNCPHDVKPEEPSLPNPWLHQNEEFVQDGKLVYVRETTGYRLIGAGSSEAAGEAIMRLMKMGESK